MNRESNSEIGLRRISVDSRESRYEKNEVASNYVKGKKLIGDTD